MTLSCADFPVYHTAFDSYDWMLNHGDPLFQRHVASKLSMSSSSCSSLWSLSACTLHTTILDSFSSRCCCIGQPISCTEDYMARFSLYFPSVAEVWGLLALHLADDPVLPLNYLSYAAQLQVQLLSLASGIPSTSPSLTKINSK